MTEDSALFEAPMKYVEWRIKNFFDLPTKDNYYIQSPKFTVSGAKWYFGIYPNGESDESVGWISLYLYKGHSTVEYRVSYKMGIQNADGSEFKAMDSKYTFPMKSQGNGKSKLVERSVMLNSKDTLAPKGFLSVFCSFRIWEQKPLSSSVEAASQTLLSDGITTLSANLKDMYLKRRLTDITIVVKSREFLAHKLVLASRSSVFACMFENDMVENKSGRIEIPDCDPDSFEEFLFFLYSGKLDVGSPSNAVNLYNISDKYDVQELKDICKERMNLNLSIDSFCDVIHLATLHSEFDLLKSATDFFIDNADNVISTTKWSMFLEENPALSNELFFKVLKSKKGKE